LCKPQTKIANAETQATTKTERQAAAVKKRTKELRRREGEQQRPRGEEAISTTRGFKASSGNVNEGTTRVRDYNSYKRGVGGATRESVRRRVARRRRARRGGWRGKGGRDEVGGTTRWVGDIDFGFWGSLD
ncbi:hypothetical protein PIB30_113481, partial [Stylosanthes scabra]|nr:hypothetical protein [Stylosanthes scabra]